jgi:hypothetical protein
MLAVKAEFDGERIVLPGSAKGLPVGEVLVVFPGAATGDGERAVWERAQQEALARVWDNEEDAVYDTL